MDQHRTSIGLMLCILLDFKSKEHFILDIIKGNNSMKDVIRIKNADDYIFKFMKCISVFYRVSGIINLICDIGIVVANNSN